MKTKHRPPFHYKPLEMGFDGKLCGSAQPGGNSSTNDADIIEAIIQGTSLEEAGVPDKLISNLNFLHEHNVRVIYNLIPSPSSLTKYIWENKFEGTTYISEINGVSTAIDNLEAPNQEQFKIITEDATTRMQNGDNILFHCAGGLGRTGTMLAAIYMKSSKNYNHEDAVNFIRREYSRDAIDSPEQIRSLSIFSRELHYEKKAPDLEALRARYERSFTEEIVKERSAEASSPQIRK